MQGFSWEKGGTLYREGGGELGEGREEESTGRGDQLDKVLGTGGDVRLS